MKAAIYLGTHLPVEGGGFTFQDEMVDALRAAGSGQRHELVLVDWAPAPALSRRARPLASLSLHGYWLSRWASRLRTIGRRPSKRAAADWIDPVLRARGLAFVCNLTPEVLASELPYLTIVWDLQHRLQPFFPEVGASREWERREAEYGVALQRAAYVIAGTRTGAREIETFFQVPSTRIRILPHPTPGFALAAPDDVSGSLHIPDGPFFFYPAQFWPHKNHVNLLHALRLLRDEHGLRPSLLLVGSDRGNLRHVQQAVDELKLAEQVKLLGFVSRADLIRLYRRAVALVYVSLFGPENLPPLEAFALGCPVIASRVPGSEEQLGGAALQVDALQPAAMAAAMKQLLLDTSARAAMIEKGRAAATRFTGRDFVNGLLSILDEFEPLRRGWSIDPPYRSI